MSSPDINAAGHGGQRFPMGDHAFVSDGYGIEHVASYPGDGGFFHSDNNHHHGSAFPDSSGPSENFLRTTTDENSASRHGFSFQNASPRNNNTQSEEHKTSTDDTLISTEQFHPHHHPVQQHFAAPQHLYPTIDKHPLQSNPLDTAGARVGLGVITSEPTLHPEIDFHDSNWAEITSRTSLHQPRLATNQTIDAANTSATSSIPNFTIDNNNNTVSLHGQQNMGYNNSTHRETAWNESSYNFTTEQKMEHGHNSRSGRNASSHAERKEHDDDSTTVRSTDSVSLSSPLHGPLPGAPPLEPNATAAGAQSTATTPSTVSTAPSTNDEGSFVALDPNALDRLALRGENLEAAAGHVFHRRGASWENPPYQSQLYVPDETDNGAFSRPPPHHHPSLPPSNAPNAWANNGQPRVASFRNDYHRNAANNNNNNNNNTSGPDPQQRWHPQQQTPRFDAHAPSTRTPPSQQQQHQPMPTPPHAQQQQQGMNYGPYHRSQLPPATPPRTAVRTPRGGPQLSNHHPHRPSPAAVSSNPNHSNTPSSSGNPRSPSEVLKTLLRKKACLYEPDTSRAVALITWLVGRVLALEHGYFSRQQLQAGVHACVARKIDSGVITRTKVNRCMQIILNSCFHYIIPRPDGTEENGDAFRSVFAHEVSDDIRLLRELPAPWNDLSVNRDVILEASAASDLEGKTIKTSPGSNPVTPQSSPKLGSIPSEKSSPRAKDDVDGDGKRAVLLCFNENVRCAEDVFRCHNEFIRDTAHASSLQLSSSEWRSFFGKEAAGAPHLWGNIGIPVPHSEASHQVDALGMMTRSELSKFRTSWCAKRYDHDHDLCGFAHVEVNGGWLRRNPEKINFKPEMCPCIVQFSSRSEPSGRYVVNSCPHGEKCEFAHSVEEIMYHPRRYKSNVCSALARPGGCPRGDVCPDFHPAESYKFPSKKGDGRLGSRQARQGPNAGKGSQAPAAAPVLYLSPAPVSRFEEQFHLPGLKNLYRRHCSVIRAHLQNPGSCVCCYSCFGDDTGTGIDPAKLSLTGQRGLPQPRGPRGV